MRHVVLDLFEALLNSLGDFDLTLTRQQFNGAHLTHVHAHGIRCTTKFGIDTGECSFCFLCAGVVRGCCVGQDQRLGVGCFFMHRNTHVINHVNDVFDLFRIDYVIRQVVIDLCIGQVALLLAAGNQIFQLLNLFVPANHCTLFAQDETTSG